MDGWIDREERLYIGTFLGEGGDWGVLYMYIFIDKVRYKLIYLGVVDGNLRYKLCICSYIISIVLPAANSKPSAISRSGGAI